MKPIIAGRVPLGDLLVPLQAREQVAVPGPGKSEVDDGGGASGQGCPSSGIEIVCGGGPHHLGVEVGVRVDGSREKEEI